MQLSDERICEIAETFLDYGEFTYEEFINIDRFGEQKLSEETEPMNSIIAEDIIISLFTFDTVALMVGNGDIGIDELNILFKKYYDLDTKLLN